MHTLASAWTEEGMDLAPEDARLLLTAARMYRTKTRKSIRQLGARWGEHADLSYHEERERRLTALIQRLGPLCPETEGPEH